MNQKNNWLANAYLMLVFIVLYTPILFLVVYSFNAGGTMNHFTRFTIEHYINVFHDTRLILIVLDTLIVAILSATIATIIGTLGSLLIYELRNRRYREVILNLNNVLMVSPDVIIGASLLILFTVLGFQLGFYSVLLAHVAFNVPIVVIMVLPRLDEMNPSLITAARDLGATPRDVLRHITLPLVMPGILSGFFMAFTYSLDDFAVTFFVTGNGFTTLSVEIFSRARRGVSLEVNALSTLIFLLSFVLIIGYHVINQQHLKRLNVMKQRSRLEEMPGGDD
ncbi:ABC transporter permease [Atopobacter phocae]|uniref:ABC transporter permease n=1 Tax=Atopobacter phocae TaxID=136492 RepID=UPI00046FB8EA|nr:ABC transporter permease [Atopobacter phocae]